MHVNRRSLDPQLDLFVPCVADAGLRDQRELMERPFFSLAKRKRIKAIEYVSPDASIFVNVRPHQDYGMATIWDADILIWAASTLQEMKRNGVNDLPRTLNFQPYDLLRTIHRDTGGREYRLLREGLSRLASTSIETNIRVGRSKKHRQFAWIEGWAELVDEETGQSSGMSVTLSDWFYEGVVMEGGVLSIEPEYFAIKGGRERWLYRVARKHAGGAGAGGFAITLPTLFEKSGAEGTYRRFKFEIAKIAKEDDLPGFALRLDAGRPDGGRDEPSLTMVRRELEGTTERPVEPGAGRPTRARKADRERQANFSHFAARRFLTEDTIGRIRGDFPGWDIYSLEADYNEWLDGADGREPTDYQAAFYGFVRARHRASGKSR